MGLNYPSDHGPCPPLVLSCLELLQDTEGASAMAEKQRKVLTELKREQVMLQEHLGLIASPLLHAALGGGWSKISYCFFVFLKGKGYWCYFMCIVLFCFLPYGDF